jgi:hypothetical protein
VRIKVKVHPYLNFAGSRQKKPASGLLGKFSIHFT